MIVTARKGAPHDGYARYAAYVENTRELSLENIPMEDYSQKQRSRDRKPKQPER